eukprot:GHRQ01027970.1.p2 GENE.GHRQ01027970.1~~GHRQ01027970.1.p2  ORF type:complete len:122 (-),score=40.27 GHRQ01027970.1:4-369(-)
MSGIDSHCAVLVKTLPTCCRLTCACKQWAKQLLQQGNTVVATARDPASSAGLSELAQQYGDKLLTTSLEASSEQGIADWAAQLKDKVPHIDVSGNILADHSWSLDLQTILMPSAGSIVTLQ